MALENILHIAPNAIANFNNIYYPNGGSVTGAFSLANFANPVLFICGLIGGVENTTAPETAKLCAQYLGPALRLLNFNNLPIPINPYLRPAIEPGPDHLHRSRSWRRAAPDPATRPSRRRRCRPTPAAATSRRRPAGTEPPQLPGRVSTRPTTTRPPFRRRRCIPRAPIPGRRTSCRTFRPAPHRRRHAAAADSAPAAAAATRMRRCCLQKGRRHHDPRNASELAVVGVVRRADADGLLLPGGQLAAAARCGGTGPDAVDLSRRGRRMSRRWSRIRRC